MLRWLMLILIVVWLPGEDESTAGSNTHQPVAAPSIFLRNLEWWCQNAEGCFGWYPGQDLTHMPAVMGRIEDLRITGTQEMVWEHAYYRLTGVRREGERTWLVGFERGTLRLTHLEHQRWQVEFTPVGGGYPTRIFRTDRPPFGSYDPP